MTTIQIAGVGVQAVEVTAEEERRVYRVYGRPLHERPVRVAADGVCELVDDPTWPERQRAWALRVTVAMVAIAIRVRVTGLTYQSAMSDGAFETWLCRAVEGLVAKLEIGEIARVREAITVDGVKGIDQ